MTLKASPLSNRGVRWKRTPGKWWSYDAPWRGAPTNGKLDIGAPIQGALRHVSLPGVFASLKRPGY